MVEKFCSALPSRAIIKIAGKDSIKFLQNLLTNDIENHQYCYTYMLNSNGRYLFDFFIYKSSEGHVIIDIAQSQAELFKSKLNFYKLRSEVFIEDVTNNYVILYSSEFIDSAIYSNRDPRYSLLGFRTLVEKSSEHIISNDVYIRHKYQFGIIDGDIDLVYEKSIPIEYAAEAMNAISYTKGCYIGQEIVSRAKYQGVIRKDVFIVSIPSGKEFSKGDVIMSGDQAIGVFCSGIDNIGMGLVRNDVNFGGLIQILGVEIKLIIPKWRV